MIYLIILLVIVTSGSIIVLFRQKSDIKILNKKIISITQSRDSSLEYIDALWKNQENFIIDEKLSSINTLVSGVAHELNTPLGISLTALSYIGDLKIDEDARVMLNLAVSNLSKSITLVEKFTEISGGNAKDKARPVELLDFFNFVSCRVKTETALYNISKIKYAINENIWINISEMSLSIVLKNIIENALDYAFNNDNEGEVTISTEVIKNDLKISVKDNGQGISEKDIKHIFDPFYTTRRADKHYGLGLSISYSLLTSHHNGSITCNSKLGHGTEMLITIPNILCNAPKQKV